MLRCIECSAYHSGAEDHDGDGFARCLGCEVKLRLSYWSDRDAPKVGHKSKTWQSHVEGFIRSLSYGAVIKVRRERGDLVDASPNSWEWPRARQLLDFPPTDQCQLPTDDRFTVKQLDIFGNVIDTYATEGEINGFRATQGLML